MKVMNCLRLRTDGERSATRIPVRRHGENGTRLADALAELLPGLRVAIALDRVHWAAVAHKNRWHASWIRHANVLSASRVEINAANGKGLITVAV